MDLATVKKWADKLSTREQDLPLFMVNGVTYTPRQLLTELAQNTTVAQKILGLLALRKFASLSAEERTLAKMRLRLFFSQKLGLEDKPRFVTLAPTAGVQPKVYTEAQLAQEVEDGTKVGNQLVDNEVNFMRKIVGMVR